MLILCCCICSIFGSWFPWRSKTWAKVLSISLPSSFSGHPGLVKYHTVQATFSRYFLLDQFSLACAIRRVAKCFVRHHGHFLAQYKSSQQLDCRENWINAYRVHQLLKNDHLSSIGLWISHLPIAKLNIWWLHGNLTIIVFRKQKSLSWLGFSSAFGKDFDDQLTAVVDVTFTPHNHPKIS